MGDCTWLYRRHRWNAVLFIGEILKMKKIIKGGYLAGYRTYIISGAGIISAIAAYLVGDTDLFITLQSIFTLGGIYFLRKSNDNKGKNNE